MTLREFSEYREPDEERRQTERYQPQPLSLDALWGDVNSQVGQLVAELKKADATGDNSLAKAIQNADSLIYAISWLKDMATGESGKNKGPKNARQQLEEAVLALDQQIEEYELLKAMGEDVDLDTEELRRNNNSLQKLVEYNSLLEDRYLRDQGDPELDSFKKCFGLQGLEEDQEFNANVNGPESTKLNPGAQEAVQALKSEGIELILEARGFPSDFLSLVVIDFYQTIATYKDKRHGMIPVYKFQSMMNKAVRTANQEVVVAGKDTESLGSANQAQTLDIKLEYGERQYHATVNLNPDNQDAEDTSKLSVVWD